MNTISTYTGEELDSVQTIQSHEIRQILNDCCFRFMEAETFEELNLLYAHFKSLFLSIISHGNPTDIETALNILLPVCVRASIKIRVSSSTGTSDQQRTAGGTQMPKTAY